MPTQSIYYVPPRLMGPIENWSGMTAVNGLSPLLNDVAAMGFNALWFSPFTETTKIEKSFHNKKLTGSLYATRNPFRMDDEFSTGDADMDRAHLQHFCAEAAKRNIRVYADLVFNHLAADHPLVLEENTKLENIRKETGGNYNLIHGDQNKLIGISYTVNGTEKSTYFKFRRNDDLSVFVGGPAEDRWSDVTEVNYESPEARRFFVEGDKDRKGYWKQVIDFFVDRGFTGFRCDVAYMIPPAVWQQLISYGHEKVPDAVFMAETLGGPQHKIAALAQARIDDGHGGTRPAFDLGMLATYWWNFEDRALFFQDNPQMQRAAQFGGAGAPDTHDTERTLGRVLRDFFNNVNLPMPVDQAIALGSVRNYALAALACSSHYMQMGYEYCNEVQNVVFKGETSPEGWQDLKNSRENTAYDIRSRIRQINELKQSLHTDNCRINMHEFSAMEGGKVVKVVFDYVDADTGDKVADMVLLMNKKPENGPVSLNFVPPAGLEKMGPEQKDISDFVIYHTPLKDIPHRKAVPLVTLRA